MHLTGILETCLYVDDLDAADAFYRDVLGLEFVGREENRHIAIEKIVDWPQGGRSLYFRDPADRRGEWSCRNWQE